MKSIVIATAKTEYLITLTNLLQERGYVVIPAVTVDSALSFLRQGIKVDAVIADYEIRNCSELIRAARPHAPAPPPLILLHDRVAVSDYLTALNAGAFDFFFWPIRPSELLRIVEAAVGHTTAESGAGAQEHNSVRTGKVQRGLASFEESRLYS
jgi:DNA-binding response OmpR family regulator